MPVIGDPQQWSAAFPRTLIAPIVGLVVRSWETFDKPNRKDREVLITRRFRSHLIQRKNALRVLPVRIEREAVEDDTESGEERGRIDLRFTAASSCREDVYFAFECKRLNVPTKRGCKTLAREYVDQGMMRFVRGQYASRLRHGGMIGYVMNGDCSRAVGSLDRFVRDQRTSLMALRPYGLSESLVVRANPSVRQTYHQLSNRSFHIHHVFLPVILTNLLSPAPAGKG